MRRLPEKVAINEAVEAKKLAENDSPHLSMGFWRSWCRLWQERQVYIPYRRSVPISKEYVQPGFCPEPYLGEGGSVELQVPFIRTYLLHTLKDWPGGATQAVMFRQEKTRGLISCWRRAAGGCQGSGGVREGRTVPTLCQITQDGTGDLFKKVQLRNELEEMGMLPLNTKSDSKYAMKVGIVTEVQGRLMHSHKYSPEAESYVQLVLCPRTGTGRRRRPKYHGEGSRPWMRWGLMY